MKAGAAQNVVAFLIAQSIYETAEEWWHPSHESHPKGLCWYIDAFS